MKSYLRNSGVALLGVLALCAVTMKSAPAQVVTQLPVYIDNSAGVTDLGNGPVELRVLQGTAQVFTSQGSGIGSTSGSSTTLTLTATAAANPPCVGCAVSGTGITAGTTVTAFNGTTGITLSAAMTVAASTAVAWGKACPTTVSSPAAIAVPGAGTDLPLYTYARVCAGAQFSAGATVLPFAIGAH